MPIILPPSALEYALGDPDELLPGSGDIQPIGVEAVLEYNGIYLNVLTNMQAYRVRSIDGLTDPEIVATAKKRTGIGETFSKSSYSGRSMVLQVEIVGNSLRKLRDMERALDQAFNDLQDHRLYFHFVGPDGNLDDSKSLFIDCRKWTSTAGNDEISSMKNNRIKQITLRAQYPRLRSVTQSQTITNLDAASKAFTLTNVGSYEAMAAYRIVGSAGNVQIINHTTGKQWLFTNNGGYTVAAGHYADVDEINHLVTLDDGTWLFKYGTINSDIPRVRPGDNDMEVITSSRGAGAQLVSTFNHTF